MIKYQVQYVEEKSPALIVCNKSRKVVDLTDDYNYVDRNMMHKFTVNFNYGSIFDSEKWSFDLDEEELLLFVKTFKIMPTGFAEGTKYPQKVFEEWIETDKFNWQAGWTEDDYEQKEQEEKERKERFKQFRGSLNIKKSKK